MKHYEGLIILKEAGRQNTVYEVTAMISTQIGEAGGRVHEIEKIGLRDFARVRDKKHASGYYLNVRFEGEAAASGNLHAKLLKLQDVFRVMISNAPAEASPPLKAAEPEAG